MLQYKAIFNINTNIAMLQSRGYGKYIPFVNRTYINNYTNKFIARSKDVDNSIFLENEQSIKYCSATYSDMLSNLGINTNKINIAIQREYSNSANLSDRLDIAYNIKKDIYDFKLIHRIINNNIDHHYISNSYLKDYYRNEYIKYSDALNSLKNILVEKTNFFANINIDSLNKFKYIDGKFASNKGAALYDIIVINKHYCFVVEKDGIFYFYTLTSKTDGITEFLYNGLRDIDQYIRTDAIAIPVENISFTSSHLKTDPTDNFFSIFNNFFFFEHGDPIARLNYFEKMTYIAQNAGIINDLMS